ncbi:asparagine synthetase [glutamine-hydrolyzing] [Strongylocentrotus purpuratus]|uniref:Asparagine synthetase [glutamine-hydrolyzing] n=1 Tax=Strongylocentrotus purpuratus TaxID=7668 RepID=A0A7M7P8E6_STRPU|nr:asparagine synthetase [glutamine-hydrolyzing] [Strongylocentrotus purpuratus]
MCGIWALFGSDVDVHKHLGSALKIAHRGPDSFRTESIPKYNNCCLCFHRLAIVGNVFGMQPLRINGFPHLTLLYNGEIYNYKKLSEAFGFPIASKMDGEILLHLYIRGGIEYAASMADGVFAMCIVDTASKQVHIGRDTYGVRPMFSLLNEDGFMAISSEAKGLLGLRHGCDDRDVTIKPFPPGHVQSFNLLPSGKVSPLELIQFHSFEQTPKWSSVEGSLQVEGSLTPTDEDIYANIRALFTEAVRKRMMGGRRIGCMLSGGLDSSLVSSLVMKTMVKDGFDYPLQTFSIGMKGSPDVVAARKVASHIGSEHHEIGFTPEEGIEAVEHVIKSLESYDITTLRASVGMYLVARYIRKETDTIVVYSGEGADELAQGYIYFHKQPDASAGDDESRRLLKDLYLYDVLRADRTTAAHGLELRCPFLDHHFTSYFLSLPKEMRCPNKGIEKYLFRKAFDGTGLLPSEILWRPKEAFSDGVSSVEKSWYEVLQEHIETKVTNDQLEDSPKRFPFNPPRSKEAYYYRQVFEKYYPGRSDWIPYIWMPKWTGATDPSARTLKHYKESEVSEKQDMEVK